MRVKKSILFTIVLAIAMIGTSAFAVLELVETSTKTEGVTTVTWDSSFHDMDYALGDTITMTVSWTVDAGAAIFHGFKVKRFTPRAKKDPAEGALIGVSGVSHSCDASGCWDEITVQFKFTDLHLDKKRNVDIGNAHFKLKLMVDENGDGNLDEVEGYGVNVHVEDPQ